MAPKKMSEAQRAASLARVESIRASQLMPPNPERDQAIEETWADIWNGIDTHITDKQYYPRYVAYAVGHTVAQTTRKMERGLLPLVEGSSFTSIKAMVRLSLDLSLEPHHQLPPWNSPSTWDLLYYDYGMCAQMVNMLCFARLNRMNSWDHPIPRQCLEQWDEDEECELPPIDSWARQCLPIEMKKKPIDAFDDIDFKNQAKAFSKHRSSETVLASVQDALNQRRNSMQLQFRPKPKPRDSEPLNIQVEADKFFTAAIARWPKLPIEESSESDDETIIDSEVGSEGSEASTSK